MTKDQGNQRVELVAMQQQLGITRDQLIDEIKAGRLAVDVDEQGRVYTTGFGVLDWINRRMTALALFKGDKVSFPIFEADRSVMDDLPDYDVKVGGEFTGVFGRSDN